MPHARGKNQPCEPVSAEIYMQRLRRESLGKAANGVRLVRIRQEQDIAGILFRNDHRKIW